MATELPAGVDPQNVLIIETTPARSSSSCITISRPDTLNA